MKFCKGELFGLGEKVLKYKEGINFHNCKNKSKLLVDPFFGLLGTLQGEKTLPQLVVIIHTIPGLIVKVKRLNIL